MECVLEQIPLLTLLGTAIAFIPLLTLLGTAIAFIVASFKWLDQRNREQDDKRFQAFHKMVLFASGVDEQGRTLKMPQQVAAIYQLQKYKQYAFASVPVLELMLFEHNLIKNEDLRVSFLLDALKRTIGVLSK